MRWISGRRFFVLLGRPSRTGAALALASLAALCPAASAMAGEVTISGTADTTACTLVNDSMLYPSCDTSTLTVGSDYPLESRTIIKFDVAGNLPEGAEITDATLRLYYPSEPGGDEASTGLYPEYTAWDVGEANWDTPDGIGTWELPGGFGWGTHPQGPESTDDHWVTFLVGGIVSYWTAETDPLPNGGFVLFGYSNPFEFETPGDAHPPELVIDYDL
jgi:hypothetical protein